MDWSDGDFSSKENNNARAHIQYTYMHLTNALLNSLNILLYLNLTIPRGSCYYLKAQAQESDCLVQILNATYKLGDLGLGY